MSLASSFCDLAFSAALPGKLQILIDPPLFLLASRRRTPSPSGLLSLGSLHAEGAGVALHVHQRDVSLPLQPQQVVVRCRFTTSMTFSDTEPRTKQVQRGILESTSSSSMVSARSLRPLFLLSPSSEADLARDLCCNLILSMSLKSPSISSLVILNGGLFLSNNLSPR
ncbi:hypothetical protein BSL78_02184 [Apostichopus japonicus]|uniref:Uncharacterized protein n=1 Tax=Stichopus japonicus TaxID=307972 RepID=A0A2G8LKS5_STIJA|nr:hypothetical protein BSL78_02184 [Apostichopus japonicus]